MTYNNYAFGNERAESDFLHDELFNAFYRDLLEVGAEGMKQMRKPNEKKVQALTRALDHFQSREEYEKCGFIKSVIDQIK